MNIILYTAARSRGLLVAWLLEELGLPHETRFLDLASAEHKSTSYRRIHPLGSVPALTVDGEPMFESLAIALFLADSAPNVGLAPLPNDPLRGRYLQWMVYATATVEPKLAAPYVRSFSRPRAEWSTVATSEERQSFSEVLIPLEKGFEQGHQLPDRITAVDILLGCQLHWADQVGLLADQPAASAYLASLRARPSWSRLSERDHPDSVYVPSR